MSKPQAETNLAYDMQEVQLEDIPQHDDVKMEPLEVVQPKHTPQLQQGGAEDRASTICFMVSLIVLWLLAFWATRSIAGWFFPIVFLPTILFVLFWRRYARHLVGFHSMTHAYAMGFYTGALAVFIYKVIVLVFLYEVVYRDPESRVQYAFFVSLYAIFGEGLGPEVMKYIIASRGRKTRQDLTDVGAYLWYSSAGAFGFATFIIILDIFFLFYYNDLEVLFYSILLRILLDIPLHTSTGLYIGIGVAKNEVLNWNTPWYRVILFPLFVRASIEATVYCVIDFVESPTDLIISFSMFAIGLIAMFIAIKKGRKILPNSFGLLSEDEINSPMPNTV